MIKARVITCSDAASRGEREDRSGPAVREMLEKNGYGVDAVVIVADDCDAIATAIENGTGDGARLVVTTGGTGIAPRDVTPEATMDVCDRLVPGIGELMRSSSLQKTPMAPLSRAQAATRGSALVLNLPGSVNGARENLEAVMHLIPHALDLLAGTTEHGKQKAEGRRQKPETRNQKAESRRQRPETGNRKPETRNRKPETGNQKLEGRKPKQ